MSGTSARVLITNDDGVDAEGITALARLLRKRGFDPTVLAPDSNRSGTARAATFGRAVGVELLGERDGTPTYACDGTTVDCVRIALLGDLLPAPDLVVSGINHGANLGDDTLNSGTVGGAAEGALLGVPSLAVSLQCSPGHFHILDPVEDIELDYAESAEIAARVCAALLSLGTPARTVLNVNVPAELASSVPRLTRLGCRRYEPGTARRQRDGRSFCTFGERDEPAPPFDDSAGTDFAAIVAGAVAVTPISYVWDDPQSWALRRWAQHVCDLVTEDRFGAESAGPARGKESIDGTT